MSRVRAGVAAFAATVLSMTGCAHAPPKAPLPEPSSPPDIAYRLRANLVGPAPALDVRACFLLPTGSLSLDIPDAHWGEEGFARTIVDLIATSAGATLTAATRSHPGDPPRRTLSGPAGTTACIAYRVIHGEGTRSESEAHWPTFARDHFYFFAFSTLIMPSEDSARARRVTLSWEPLPTGWTHGSNLGERADGGDATSVTVDDLADTVVFAGDYRVHTLDVRGRPVRLALRGTWARSDAELVSAVGRIIGAERAFFADDTAPTYLVVLSPYGHFDNMGGEGLPNAFAAYASPEMSTVKVSAREVTPDEAFLSLLAHEMFHHWNGGSTYETHPDGVLYWMSEGFTDYFARRILLQTGLIDFDGYVRSVDAVLGSYDLSSARTLPNARVVQDFWKDRAIEKLPYQRGDILAQRWNAQILAHSAGQRSFDDVMRALYGDARAHGPFHDRARFLAIMRGFLPGGVEQDVDAYVEGGAAIPRGGEELGPCARQVPTVIQRFVRGFSRAESESSGKISGVVRGSNAERAGVRDGMTLRKLDPANDPKRPTDLLVEDGGVVRHIVYLPSSLPRATTTFEPVVPLSPAQSAACLPGIGLRAR